MGQDPVNAAERGAPSRAKSINHRLWHIAALAAPLVLAVGCNEDTSQLTLLRPKMEVSPESGTPLVFDPVILTRTKGGVRSVRVSNVGDGLLTLNSISIDGTDKGAFFISDAPTQVLPGDSKEVYVRLDPRAPGDKEAVLTITSNDNETPEVSFPLSAKVTEPCVLFADQTRMVFKVGEIQTLKLTSVTTAACVVDRLFTDTRIFPFVNGPELPVTIEGGQTLELQIEHKAISTRFPGVPVRELLIRDDEDRELVVLLEGEAPLSGCLSLFPDQIQFPQTVKGQTRRQRTTVSNRCGRDATITSVVVSRGWGAFTVDGTYPATVPAARSLDIWITYVPQTEFDNGRITINTNDAANQRLRVSVDGVAALPDVEAFPYSLDFGTVVFRNPTGTDMRSECSSSARFVEIHSTGVAPLTVNRLEVRGSDELFQITGVLVDGQVVQDFTQPFEIPQSKAAQVALQFFPTRDSPSEHTSELVIHHNGRSSAPRVIALKGAAATDGPVTDTFRQLEGPKVDILWVIDNSCSMYDEQARLINNLSQFVGYADSQNADYQMGVITTDSRSTEAGKLQFCYPHPRIVRHDYADREEAFRCLFNVGVTGPYIEAGLGAAMKGLQLALRTGDDPVRNPNMGFLRDGASLAVVTMSDEDDQSLETDDLLTRFFQTVRGSGRTTVHAIAGPTQEVCQTRQAAPGYRYDAMVQRMGGLFQNICLEDWQPVLRNLGLNVFVPLERWELSQAASPASITVTVDGVPVIRSPTNGFTYNASMNYVQLHGTAVPTPGQEIVVSYVGNCQP